MRKNIFIVCLIIVFCLILTFLILKLPHSKINKDTSSFSLDNSSEESGEKLTESFVLNPNSVSYNGWLKTNGSRLENEKGQLVQLRGLSSHGIEWFSDVITYQNLEELKNNWKINVFRIAVYTDSNGYGYIFSPETTTEKVYEIVDTAINLDMYVVVDWHILNDNNPQIHKEDAKSFFNELSSKYSNVPNVIYEICNEPNGSNVTWNNDVKPYAEELIPIIRNNSEKSLIIVGTPNWCKDLKNPAENPLDFENVVYSCHFYSGSHGSDLRRSIDYCIQKNIPVFISECGLTDASGNGDVYFDEFKKWIDYLNNNNISWIYWSFSNKNESSAILVDTYVPANPTANSILEASSNTTANNNESIDININLTSNNEQSDSIEINNINDYLTESGKFLKSILLSYFD